MTDPRSGTTAPRSIGRYTPPATTVVGLAASRVSVVIPCYNRAGYIGEAVASALAQTYPPAEVLVVDDASTDASVAVVERLVALDARVRLLRRPTNGGCSAARNMGLAAASGELVAMLDSDDVWEPEHLATLAPLLERHPTAAVAAAAVRYFDRRDGTFIPKFPAGAPHDVLLTTVRRFPCLQQASLFRRSALLALGGYDESLRRSEDWDLYLRLAARHPFVCTHVATMRVRIHGGERLGGDWQATLRASWQVRTRMVDALRQAGDAFRADQAAAELAQAWRAELVYLASEARWRDALTVLGRWRTVPGVSAPRALRMAALLGARCLEGAGRGLLRRLLRRNRPSGSSGEHVDSELERRRAA